MLLAPMLSRLTDANALGGKIEACLRDVIALHGAEMGNVQFPGSDGQLVIVAAQGLGPAFLKVFERVALDAGTVCGRAARSGKPVFVADVRPMRISSRTWPSPTRCRFARSFPFR